MVGWPIKYRPCLRVLSNEQELRDDPERSAHELDNMYLPYWKECSWPRPSGRYQFVESCEVMFLLVPHVLDEVADLGVLENGVLACVDPVGPELPGVVNTDHAVDHCPGVCLLRPA